MKSLYVYQWNWLRNVGDAFNAYLIRELFGVNPVWVRDKREHLLAAGSVIGKGTEDSHVWGSGILSPEDQVPEFKSGAVHALRGRLSEALLRERGAHFGDVPLGDPGILVSRLLEKQTSVKTDKFRCAVVPHHSSRSDPWVAKFRASTEFCVVDVGDISMTPIEQIASSDVVLAESLHGLIFAESFGKPVVWLSKETNPQWTFKFRDWFSTCRQTEHAPISVDESVSYLLSHAQRNEFAQNVDSLLAAFPLDMLAVEPSQPLLEFVTCRQIPFVRVRLDENILKSAAELDQRSERLVVDALTRLFTTWAEPTYAAVVTGKNLTDRQVMDAVDFLENNSNVEFVAICVDEAGTSFQSDRAIRFQSGSIAETAVALVVRPTNWLSRQSLHGTLQVG